MLPSLPQFDPQPDERAAAIANNRTKYALNRDFGDLPFPDSVPLSEEPSPKYLIEGAAWSAKSAANIAAAQAKVIRDAPEGGLAGTIHQLKAGLRHSVMNAVFGGQRDARVPNWRERDPMDLAEYEMFPLVREPQSLHLWRHDWYFARERVAGCNPLLIRNIDALPSNLPLKSSDYARAMPGDSLTAALAEQRVFLLDHAMLDGIGAGTGDGYRKWLYAPLSLFALTPDRQHLRPVCIQCSQVPGPKNPLFFPWDGVAWMMARTTVQVSDSNFHGVVQHGTQCHIVMGLFSVCMHRTLAPTHPMFVLMTPNLQFSVFVDNLTEGLFAPDGRTPVIQSVSEQGTLDLSHWAVSTFDWNDESVPNSFENRGVLSPDVLPYYPARDDLVRHWNTARSFVSKYAALYYASDADVVADTELQAFVALMQARDGGRLKGIGVGGRIHTVHALVDFFTQAIQRASSLHAVINYSVYDTMGFMPNMPMAQYAPAPHNTQQLPEDLAGMLPPRSEMYRQFNDVYVVASLRANKLGHYCLGHFKDRRVLPLVDGFQFDLQQLEFDIEQRNRNAVAPYEILKPSLVTASIHV